MFRMRGNFLFVSPSVNLSVSMTGIERSSFCGDTVGPIHKESRHFSARLPTISASCIDEDSRSISQRGEKPIVSAVSLCSSTNRSFPKKASQVDTLKQITLLKAIWRTVQKLVYDIKHGLPPKLTQSFSWWRCMNPSPFVGTRSQKYSMQITPLRISTSLNLSSLP